MFLGFAKTIELARTPKSWIMVALYLTFNTFLVPIGSLLLDFRYLPCNTPGARSQILPVTCFKVVAPRLPASEGVGGSPDAKC